MRRTTKAVSAASLAAATVLSGLSFGTAATAVPATPSPAPTVAERVDPDLAAVDFTASGVFPSDVTSQAIVLGNAEKGARVEVKDSAKRVVGSAVADGVTGAYLTRISAPDAGGTHGYTVSQSIPGGSVSTLEVTLDYGTAVTITTPGANAKHPGGPLVMSGTGMVDGEIVVLRNGRQVGNTTVRRTGEWTLTTEPLSSLRQTLEVRQTSKGANTTTASVTVNPDGSSTPLPTGSVKFDADVHKRATVSGTGAEGAVIALFRGSSSQEIGKAIVENGVWSTTIAALGAGSHVIHLEQSGIDGIQSATTTVDYGAAVSLAGPNTFTNGAVTVTGTSSSGAQVTITTGGKTVANFVVTSPDGSFTRQLTGVGAGRITLTATAKSRGALTTATTHTPTSPITPQSIAMTSHAKDGTFVPGTQTFTGRATVGTTVILNPFGFDDRYSALDLTTTVDQFGEWRITRGLSDVPYSLFGFKQTVQPGVTNQVVNYNLTPATAVGRPGDLALNTFTAGDFFTPGNQTFSGRATPGAKVVLNPFGFDPKYAAYDVTTTADATTGAWQVQRGLADTVYRELAVRQAPEQAGKVNRIEGVTIAANSWVGTPDHLTVTSHSTPTFTPGTEQTFTGRATAGTTVTLYPFGTAFASHAMTTKASATGNWTIKRTLGNQVFPMVVTQTTQPGKVNAVDLKLTPTR